MVTTLLVIQSQMRIARYGLLILVVFLVAHPSMVIEDMIMQNYITRHMVIMILSILKTIGLNLTDGMLI